MQQHYTIISDIDFCYNVIIHIVALKRRFKKSSFQFDQHQIIITHPKFMITDEGVDFVINDTKWRITFKTKKTLSIINILIDLQLKSDSNIS